MDENSGDNTPKIIHQSSALGEGQDDAPPPLPPTPTAEGTKSKIRTFEKARQSEREWTRNVNSPGTGAVRVKTFHSKLTEDGLRYMDDTINEWLDEHKDHEVKFATSTIGVFTSKIKEPQMICQVWY